MHLSIIQPLCSPSQSSNLRHTYGLPTIPTMKRRTDIRAEIALLRSGRAAVSTHEAQEVLASVLDGLNTMGTLDALRQKRFNRYLAHGPKAVFGMAQFPWVGAVIWHRPAGYYGFKTLTLFGAWAFREAIESQPLVVVAAKRVPYAADFFEAEAYMKLMKRDFSVYYQDDGSPPVRENWLWSVVYAPAERMTQRQQLAEALARYV